MNRVRKDKARTEDKARADANAAFHGLTKAEKERAKAEAARVARLHAQSRRDER
nr:DUF4169 family protein [Oceanicola sp. 502str15]